MLKGNYCSGTESLSHFTILVRSTKFFPIKIFLKVDNKYIPESPQYTHLNFNTKSNNFLKLAPSQILWNGESNIYTILTFSAHLNLHFLRLRLNKNGLFNLGWRKYDRRNH